LPKLSNIKHETSFLRQISFGRISLHLSIQNGPVGHWRRKGGRGSWSPLDFEIFSKRKVVFLVSGGKSNFTTFGPPLEKFRKNPRVLLLEKILLAPMPSAVLRVRVTTELSPQNLRLRATFPQDVSQSHHENFFDTTLLIVKPARNLSLRQVSRHNIFFEKKCHPK